jgi:DNA-directed RNA polymerase subunit RPC12/RpoP
MMADTNYTCPACGEETGGGSHWHCANCGRESSQFGHWNGSERRFMCEPDPELVADNSRAFDEADEAEGR